MATHDFPDKELGKAIPYGVYDLAHNEAGVTVGISHDTAEFAAAAIHRWWTKLGRKRYPSAKRLLITADCGGSNSPRTRLWRWELQRLANATGLKIEVCHFPPGTSKWNKDEKQYVKSRLVTDEQLLDVRIVRDTFHGEWDYTILPDR